LNADVEKLRHVGIKALFHDEIIEFNDIRTCSTDANGWMLTQWRQQGLNMQAACKTNI
jgi:hypothetical protein